MLTATAITEAALAGLKVIADFVQLLNRSVIAAAAASLGFLGVRVRSALMPAAAFLAKSAPSSQEITTDFCGSWFLRRRRDTCFLGFVLHGDMLAAALISELAASTLEVAADLFREVLGREASVVLAVRETASVSVFTRASIAEVEAHGTDTLGGGDRRALGMYEAAVVAVAAASVVAESATHLFSLGGGGGGILVILHPELK